MNNIYVYIVPEHDFEYYKTRYNSYIKIIERKVNKSVNLYIIKNEDIKNEFIELLENIIFNINNIKTELCILFDMIDYYKYECVLHKIANFDKIKIIQFVDNNNITYYSVNEYLKKYY